MVEYQYRASDGTDVYLNVPSCIKPPQHLSLPIVGAEDEVIEAKRVKLYSLRQGGAS